VADTAEIAIVGMACRLAGASDWRQFWDNLCLGRESLEWTSDADLLAAGVPPEQIRDPQYVKGAFAIEGHDLFDAGFFGYSPHEARLIDPQQRHLLEVAWEAFEDAGYPPGRSGGPVAVYASTGSVVTNYMMNALSGHADAHYGGTGSPLHYGNDKDYASTRISFKLDLTGPSLNVQTACSTSLVLIDLARKAIRDGECGMALVAAATVRVPHRAGYLAVKGSIFSTDGHIRPFDADAQGTTFGSGVAAVLLKELGQAIADGDNIYAVIRGSAVNNDGARKPSYTGTSQEAQGEVMRKALAQAGYAPSTIGYVECHGTGTTMGDPKEFAAVKSAFAGWEGAERCPIGSVKPNVGHTENAAGLVSLIKTALMVRHGVVPATVNFRTPNPLLKIESSPFLVNGETQPWRHEAQPRRALINALGMGGTNAALAIEEAPRREALPDGQRRKTHLFLLSAKTEVALGALVARHRAVLEAGPEPDLGDLCHTLATGRVHFAHRYAVAAQSCADVRTLLAAYGTGKSEAIRRSPRRVAFLYSGQGLQVAGMGRSLYDGEPAFRAALDRVAAALDPHLDRPLLDILFSDAESSTINHTAHTQPALFAVQVALAQCLEAWGIRPVAVAGHSVGEFAAAHLAGVLSLEDAARLVAVRGRLMGALPEGGAMAAVFADEATVSAVLADLPADRIALAAANGPHNTVISGEAEVVAQALATLERRGFPARSLPVSHAFHSPLIAPALDGLAREAEGVATRPPALAWVSTLTGQPMTTAPDGDYWRRQAREPVRFVEAARKLAELGTTEFIEIGPGNALLSLARESVTGEDLAWLPTLGKGGDECRTLLESVAGLHRRGNTVDWRGFHAPFPSRRLSLPCYPFQHERFWPTPELQIAESRPQPVRAQPASLAGTCLPSPLPVRQFATRFGRGSVPWLDDHRLHGTMVLPVATGIAAALEAARPSLGPGDLELVEYSQDESMVLADDEERHACLLIESEGERQVHFTLTSRDRDGEPWLSHMQGAIRLLPPDRPAAGGFDAKRIQRRCGQSVKASAYYGALQSLGLGYGPAFRCIESLWRGDGEALARIRLPDSLTPEGNGPWPHPVLLDACLHLTPAVVEAHGDFNQPPPTDAVLHLPQRIERFRPAASAARELWCHARRRPQSGEDGRIIIDIEAHDLDGTLALAFEGIEVAPVSPDRFHSDGQEPKDGWLYQMNWEECGAVPPVSGPGPEVWLLLGGDGDGTGPALASALEAAGATVRQVAAADLPGTPEDMAESLRAFATLASRRAAGIVHLSGLDATSSSPPLLPSDEALQRRTLGTALAVARALTADQSPFETPPRLWLVTRNAVAASEGDPPTDVVQAGLWGFGRSLALEAPAYWGGLFDLEAGAGQTEDAALLAARLLRPDREAQSAFRGNRRLVARLTRVPPPVPTKPPQAGGTYLVTGGFGALGSKVAEWLADRRKAEILVLASRQGGKAEGADALIRRIEARGTKVVVVKADIGRRADVRRLLRRIRDLAPPLRGIYHCAGLIDDGLVEGMEWEKFHHALAPKLDAGWWLHEGSRDFALDEFVLFSSVLSVLGSAGQTNYTTANACLDALATHRRRLGLPALAINWGPWTDGGMASGLGGWVQAGWKARGLNPIRPELGIETFDSLFGSGLDHAVVALVDWLGFMRQFSEPPPLVAHLHRDSVDGLAADIQALRPALASGSPAERRAALTRFMRQQVTVTLGLSELVDPTRPLRELGLDSLMAVTLINRVEAATGFRIPAIKMIPGPSIDQLVEEVWPDLAGADAPAPTADAPNGPTGESGPAAESWLVNIATGANPRSRLFCFPFAGGGSAAFRGWAATMDPSIEVIAVEPPGRLSRITEAPLRDIGQWTDRVMEAVADKLDLPFAMFGHCLGSLTLYEVACRLADQGGRKPAHLFCSGARSPDRLKVMGPFESSLMKRLARLPGYRTDLPPYRQPGPVFAEIVRHFDIAASETLLAEPELRRLMLPAVRADFEMASKYRYRRRKPLDVPITCFVAIGDIFVAREDILGWGRFTNKRLQILMREGTHYSVFEDEAFIQRTIARELTTSSS